MGLRGLSWDTMGRQTDHAPEHGRRSLGLPLASINLKEWLRQAIGTDASCAITSAEHSGTPTKTPRCLGGDGNPFCCNSP
jgi:hypothetical protein